MTEKYAIWKYNFDIGGEFIVEMPRGAKVLTVQMQADRPCLWALVNLVDARTDERTFVVVGTGHPFDPTGREYVGTIQDGSFVWHIWEQVRS